MKRILLTASLVALMAAPAMAQDEGGWYVRANAGYGSHHDIDFEDGILSGDVESEGNVTGTVGIGYDFGGTDWGNWRLELDADSLWTDMGAIGQEPSSFAKLRTNSLMLNAIYDFEGFSRWEPYVGAGLGLIQADLNAQAHDFINAGGSYADSRVCLGTGFPGACSIDDKDTAWGWQLLAGLGYQITDNLYWDTNYSYQKAADSFEFDSNFTSLGEGLASFNHTQKIDDIGAHLLVTGLRYHFGGSYQRPMVTCWDGSMEDELSDCPARPEPKPTYTCWDGSVVETSASCPARPEPTTYTCWDGSSVLDLNSCPAQPETITCWDGSLVYDRAQCPAVPEPTIVSSYNVCGPSNVAIFNVPANATPKALSRLGTMPEFGDSHDLTPTQFFEKLQSRYNSSATDKAYLNYLFKSMGYTNGFADAQAYMFSEDVLPVGTSGILGLGEQHHYQYSVLPSNDRDRQAFRIQSANGVSVHFMKTCGNYFYACD